MRSLLPRTKRYTATRRSEEDLKQLRCIARKFVGAALSPSHSGERAGASPPLRWHCHLYGGEGRVLATEPPTSVGAHPVRDRNASTTSAVAHWVRSYGEDDPLVGRRAEARRRRALSPHRYNRRLPKLGTGLRRDDNSENRGERMSRTGCAPTKGVQRHRQTASRTRCVPQRLQPFNSPAAIHRTSPPGPATQPARSARPCSALPRAREFHCEWCLSVSISDNTFLGGKSHTKAHRRCPSTCKATSPQLPASSREAHGLATDASLTSSPCPWSR